LWHFLPYTAISIDFFVQNVQSHTHTFSRKKLRKRERSDLNMQLTFLGTGAGIPAKARNVTSIALKLLEETGSIWLFDCGEATQHQILHTNIKPRRVEKVFITHLHGDHLYGLPGFLASRSFQGGETPLTVYGPKGIAEYIAVSLKVSQTYLKYELKIVEIEDGIILDEDKFTVEAKMLEHGVVSFGYRIVEKNKPGVLQTDKLAEIGVKPGPIFKEIKAGRKVTLEDGSIIDGRDFVGPSIKGRIVTILGDTRTCQAAVELAKDADVLVHEATFAEGEADIAKEYYHSTTTHAAANAKAAGAKFLILTHISARYDCADSLLEEAKRIFPPSSAAEDFKEYDIPVQKDSD